MEHQAKKLEEIVSAKQKNYKKNLKIKFICFSSGKGGVGKSTIVANMGHYLATYGFRVLVLDADIGLANLDIIFNKKFDKNILHLLKGEATFEQIITPVDKNLDFIAGDSGEEILKYSDDFIFDRFLEEVSIIDRYDFILIDTGAGIGQYVKPFLLSCDKIIITLTTEPSSIANAYAMIKSVASRHKQVFLLINKVKNKSEAMNIFEQISKVVLSYIKTPIKVSLLGHIKYDKKINDSTLKRVLFIKNNPKSKGSIDLSLIGRELLLIMEQNLIVLNKIKVHTLFSKITAMFRKNI